MRKRIIICLETLDGIKEEAKIDVPTSVADTLKDSNSFHELLETIFDQANRVVLNVEIVEELRHEFPRREVWTEEERIAYRKQLKVG